MEADQTRRAWTWPASLRALRHPNYRLFISGQIVSLTGGWIQNTAIAWLVYNLLTQSSFYLGLMHFGLQLPILLLGLVAGAVADRVNRHKLIIICQFLFMAQAIALTYLTLVHHDNGMPLITFSSAMMLAIFAGILHAFDMPARQAFLLEMVPREDIANAVALNSLTFNGARIIGPSIAGIFIAQFGFIRPNEKAFGEGMCFLINTLTFIAVLYSLFRMKMEPTPRSSTVPGMRFRFLTDGISFVRKHQHVKALLGHLTIMAIFGVPYLMIMPVYAREVLAGGAHEFGVLMTAVGVGAVFGGIIMTRRPSIKGLGSHMSKCVFGFSAMLFLLAVNSSFFSAAVIMALVGFFMVMAMIASQTLVQTVLPEDIRGRVMSIYGMISIGFLPFGSLASGAMAETWGVRWTFAINAAACALATAYYTLRLPELRKSALSTPEYRQAIGLK